MMKEKEVREGAKEIIADFPEFTVEHATNALLAVMNVATKGKSKNLEKLLDKLSTEYPGIYLELGVLEHI